RECGRASRCGYGSTARRCIWSSRAAARESSASRRRYLLCRNASEAQHFRVAYEGQRTELREDLFRHRLVDPDDRDRLTIRMLAAEIQRRDVDPGAAEQRAQRADVA